jgi:hypothetical protein
VLLSKYNSAKCMIEEKRFQQAITPLKAVVQNADAVGLKNVSTEATLSLAEALMGAHQYLAAKKEIETAQTTSEKLGLQLLQARSHYLLGRVMELSGNATAEAAPHYATAKRMLASIRQESGSDGILKREDLSSISSPPARKP